MGDGIGPKTMFEKIWARHAIARDPTDPHTRLRGKAGITNPEICGMVDLLDQNTRRPEAA